MTQKSCPRCNSELKLRTAKTGSQFWGCKAFPQCRYTEPFEDAKGSPNNAPGAKMEGTQLLVDVINTLACRITDLENTIKDFLQNQLGGE